MQERVVREIRTLRAKWWELETELRSLLNGHEGGNPGHGQASVLMGHRASSRPYQPFRPTDRFLPAEGATSAKVLGPPRGPGGLSADGKVGGIAVPVIENLFEMIWWSRGSACVAATSDGAGALPMRLTRARG